MLAFEGSPNCTSFGICAGWAGDSHRDLAWNPKLNPFMLLYTVSSSGATKVSCLLRCLGARWFSLSGISGIARPRARDLSQQPDDKPKKVAFTSCQYGGLKVQELLNASIFHKSWNRCIEYGLGHESWLQNIRLVWPWGLPYSSHITPGSSKVQLIATGLLIYEKPRSAKMDIRPEMGAVTLPLRHLVYDLLNFFWRLRRPITRGFLMSECLN